MRVVTLDGLGQTPTGSAEVVTEESTSLIPAAALDGLKYYYYGMTVALAGFVFWGASQITEKR